MKEIPLKDKQELLNDLCKQYEPTLADFIVAINDVLYQYHLDGGLPYFETDIEAKNIANQLIEVGSIELDDIEGIVIDVYKAWFGDASLQNGVPEPALIAIRSALQAYYKNSSKMSKYRTPYIRNDDTFLLFFHGLDSSDDTSKFTCISRDPKYCQTVDYRHNFKNVFATYDNLIQKNLSKYPRVVLAGHSLGGWFANHFAHKYDLRALLIAPCINPSEVLADRIPVVGNMELPFLTTNQQQTFVMIEVEDERLDVATARKTLVNLPKSWQVDYFVGGHHRIAREYEIWERLNDLCDDPIVFIDEAEFLGD